jgi:hypothetical protein
METLVGFMLRDKECIYLLKFVWDKPVGIAMDYRWKPRVRPMAEARNYSLLHCVQTVTAACPTPCLMSKGAPSTLGKRLWSKADHSTPYSNDVKNGRVITYFPVSLHGMALN